MHRSLLGRNTCLVASLLGSFAPLACSGPPPAPAPSPEVAPPAASTAIAPASTTPPSAEPPKPPTDVVLSLDGQAPCRIAAVANPLASATLRFHGRAFARRSGAKNGELNVGPKGAWMRLEDDEIELVGEVDPKAVQAVPLDESMLIGGYVRVLESRLASIDGNHASLAVRGVSYVKPKKPLALDLPCDKIALGTRAPAPQQGKAVELRPGLSEPFSVTKGGEVVGTLVTPKAAPPPKTPPEGGAKVPPFTGYLAGVLSGPSEQVFELAREGGQVQLRITGFTEETTGWVRATAVKGERDGQGGGGLGMRGRRPQRVVCADAVPIYLRSGDEVVRAGQFKPKAHITRDPAPDHTTGKPEEAVIELAQGGWLGGLSVGAGDAPGATGPEVRAFVQASLLEGCAPEAPSADH